MKKLVSLFAFVLAMTVTVFAQQSIQPAKPGVNYGKTITAKNAISVKKLEQSLKEKKEYTGKIEGEVVGVCKEKRLFSHIKKRRTRRAYHGSFQRLRLLRPYRHCR